MLVYQRVKAFLLDTAWYHFWWADSDIVRREANPRREWKPLRQVSDQPVYHSIRVIPNWRLRMASAVIRNRRLSSYGVAYWYRKSVKLLQKNVQIKDFVILSLQRNLWHPMAGAAAAYREWGRHPLKTKPKKQVGTGLGFLSQWLKRHKRM